MNQLLTPFKYSEYVSVVFSVNLKTCRKDKFHHSYHCLLFVCRLFSYISTILFSPRILIVAQKAVEIHWLSSNNQIMLELKCSWTTPLILANVSITKSHWCYLGDEDAMFNSAFKPTNGNVFLK